MSWQRRRGRPITFYGTVTVIDRRGNEILVPDSSKRIDVRCVESADRSNRAEAPGQISVEVIRVIVPSGLPDVNLWAIAHYDGRWWDIITPASRRHGKAGVRHFTFLLRLRPNDGGLLKGVSDGDQ